MIKRKKELVEYARRLKLASLAEHMTEIIHEAQEKQPTYSEFLFSCLAKEVGERDRKSFLSRIKVAGLPARHTLDEYDFNRTEGLDGKQLRELRELTWMSRAYNLLLVGGPGTGKTFIASGANLLRGGAFKPRTSPYSFQGLGLEGLDILCAVKEETGLPIVTELMSTDYLDIFNEKVDLIQIGARNMQNFDLLKQLGQVERPILLKRGLNATYGEWIMSAEYIMASGNENIILCERGIRTFETYTRNTLDLQSIPVLRKLTHLPIIVDPSHAGGKWWLVDSMAKASIAAGADGLMVEVHNNPECALCDGAQSLKPDKFNELINDVTQIAKVLGKTL